MNQITYSHSRFRQQGQFVSIPDVIHIFHQEYLHHRSASFTSLLKLAKFDIYHLLPCVSDCFYYPLPVLQSWLDQQPLTELLRHKQDIFTHLQLLLEIFSKSDVNISKYMRYITWEKEFKELLFLFQCMTHWFQTHSKKEHSQFDSQIDVYLDQLCAILLQYN